MLLVGMEKVLLSLVVHRCWYCLPTNIRGIFGTRMFINIEFLSTFVGPQSEGLPAGLVSMQRRWTDPLIVFLHF